MVSVSNVFFITIATVLISSMAVSGIPPDARPCFEFLCRCDNFIANCSNHGDSLPFIPKLESWVTNVSLFYFDYNRLSTIKNNTMGNLTPRFDVFYLTMKNNNIEHIEAGAFKKFKNLLTLDLSYNPLIVKKDLQASFYNMPNTFGFVYLNGLNITDEDLDSSLLEGLTNSTMNGIHLQGNNLTVFDYSHFADFTNLVTLTLESNQITDVAYINRSYPSLITLWLNDNRLTEISFLCQNGKMEKAVFPSLYSLDLNLNNISSVPASVVPCLKNLNRLFLSGNSLTSIEHNTFVQMTDLEILNISRNTQPLEIEQNAFGNGVLKSLDLSDSKLTYLNDDAFQKSGKLKSVDLSFTNFTGWDKKLQLLLEPCSETLMTFKCRGCNLTQVPTVTPDLKNLTELILDNNRITGLKKNAFIENRKLKTLDLSHNNISRLSESSLPESVRSILENVSLEGNPFFCDCDLLWLKEWLLSAKSLFRKRLSFYRCQGPLNLKGKILVNVESISQRSCHSDNYMLFHAIFVVCTVLLCLLCFALGYKWSWNIRYRLKWGRSGRTTSGECQFLLSTDAYVLFCDEDFMFVRHQILPNLEERGHLKLCFRSRDFNPKVHVMDCVINNLSRSRKVLFVVSNSFFKDARSTFELSLVKKHLGKEIEGSVVMVIMEDIEPRYMSPDLDKLMSGRQSIRLEPENGLVVWQFLLSQLKS